MHAPSQPLDPPHAQRDACVAALQQAQQDVTLTPLAQTLTSLPRWQAFMRLHVFAVWDFMSLLKRLQRDLLGFSLPWTPGPGGAGARLIAEIALAEETDDDGRGQYCSHFETYCEAMREAGADAGPIMHVVAAAAAGHDVSAALRQVDIPAPVRQFVAFTLRTALQAAPHEVAAAFLFGREAVLPSLFSDLLAQVQQHHHTLGRLAYYFARHIEVDGDDHGPKALLLLTELCGDDAKKWQQAQACAQQSLQLRGALWRCIGAQVHGLPAVLAAS